MVSSKLAVIISGDGGWADIDRQLADTLAHNGIATIGFNSLKYFWHPRDANTFARDLSRALLYYADAWHKTTFVLIGYSIGADVLPAAVNRFSAELHKKIELLVLLGASPTVSYEFHLSNWLGDEGGPTEPTLPEIDRISDIPILCVYGTDEKDTVCKRSRNNRLKQVPLAGGHHFGGDYKGIANRIENELGATSGP
jgi:type IV secretory pathway VirJ component